MDTYWLIEKELKLEGTADGQKTSFKTVWLALVLKPLNETMPPEEKWTENRSEAIRFPKEADAREGITVVMKMGVVGELKATEHSDEPWPDFKRSDHE